MMAAMIVATIPPNITVMAGVSTAIILVGLPILVATLAMSRGFAVLERARIGPVLGRRVPHPAYRSVRDQGLLRRTFAPPRRAYQSRSRLRGW